MVAAVAVGGPCGTMVASAACVDCEWHAVVAAAVGVAEAAVAGVGSSDSGADCGVAAAVVAFAVAAVAFGATPELDCHCDLGIAAFAVGILDWKRRTSVTLAKDAAVAGVVAAGYCHLSELACPGASTSVATAGLDGVASDSRECFHRAYPAVECHRASAGGSAAAVEERSAGPWGSDGEHSPDGDAVAVAGVLAVGCVVVGVEDAIL